MKKNHKIDSNTRIQTIDEFSAEMIPGYCLVIDRLGAGYE